MTTDAHFLRGIPIAPLQEGYGQTQPPPANDPVLGRVFSFQPATPTSPEHFKLEQPRIIFGPSALDSVSGEVPLIGGQWNLLAGQVPGDGQGMRYGMAVYCSLGRWGIPFGQVLVQSYYPNTFYHLAVIQGVLLDDDQVGRPGIRSKPFEGQAGLQVGGGGGTSPACSDGLLSIPFCAPDISVPPTYQGQPFVLPGQVCEVLVYVFPHVAPGQLVGKALNSLPASQLGGGVGISHVTKLTAIRWNEY